MSCLHSSAEVPQREGPHPALDNFHLRQLILSYLDGPSLFACARVNRAFRDGIQNSTADATEDGDFEQRAFLRNLDTLDLNHRLRFSSILPMGFRVLERQTLPDVEELRQRGYGFRPGQDLPPTDTEESVTGVWEVGAHHKSWSGFLRWLCGKMDGVSQVLVTLPARQLLRYSRTATWESGYRQWDSA